MKVVIAEKPSVAKDIAEVLGAKNRREGYFEGNGYIVTFAFGHLVTIAEPEEMNPSWGKPWRLEQLPMIPDNWKYRVADKAGPQFKVIKKLFNDPSTTSIICATDAGREGEHIFRLIYKLSACKKPVQRLWISSLTEKAIRDGFNKLKPLSDFDNLAYAASGRAHADWIVGLNFTRAYTTINRQICTIGRVQTPTLALIVERQNAIDNFKPTPFFEVHVIFEPGFVAHYMTAGTEAQTRLPDKPSAQAIIDAIKSERKGIVASIETSEKRNKAPGLYNLLSLQRDANRYYGYTAQETLNAAQSLYEQYKAISYPRTESRHLSSDMIDELPNILSSVMSIANSDARKAFAKEGLTPGGITADQLRKRLGKNYVDDSKLTDHHAIIPTGAAGGMPEKLNNIYQLIALRFLSIFLPPEIRDETETFIKIKEHSFRARGTVIKDPGWTVIYGKSKKEEEDAEEGQELPPLKKGQDVAKRSETLKEGKTTAPKPYDDATLLTAMKNAGRELDDEDLAAYMKQNGLGTPATRAAIIERLLQSEYVLRVKKTLVPTDKGRAIIGAVHPQLKDAALTASWEQQLSDMQEGKLPLNKFEGEIALFVRKLLPDVAKSTFKLPPVAGGGGGANGGKGRPAEQAADGIAPCPQCQEGVVRKTPKGAGCSRWRDGCNFTIWRQQYGKKLTDNQIKELAVKGRTKTIKGFKKKDGSGKYDAPLVVGPDFKVRPEFKSGEGKAAQPVVDVDIAKCPLCKKGVVRASSKGAGCSRWRDGCTFNIWRTQYGKELADDQLKELIENRRTQPIHGFRRMDGSGTYGARLILSDDLKVRLQFDNS
ncbi:MAG TPA: DNA topoisomerase 3 [Planktothrix sp.]|jgi:DNA topoisomerase-3